jgi:hypothetical protein
MADVLPVHPRAAMSESGAFEVSCNVFAGEPMGSQSREGARPKTAARDGITKLVIFWIAPP